MTRKNIPQFPIETDTSVRLNTKSDHIFTLNSWVDGNILHEYTNAWRKKIKILTSTLKFGLIWKKSREKKEDRILFSVNFSFEEVLKLRRIMCF